MKTFTRWKMEYIGLPYEIYTMNNGIQSWSESEVDSPSSAVFLTMFWVPRSFPAPGHPGLGESHPPARALINLWRLGPGSLEVIYSFRMSDKWFLGRLPFSMPSAGCGLCLLTQGWLLFVLLALGMLTLTPSPWLSLTCPSFCLLHLCFLLSSASSLAMQKQWERLYFYSFSEKSPCLIGERMPSVCQPSEILL